MGSTRDRLLDAAQHLFAAEGFTATSIRKIAEGVGIREASVYAHFANKQAILDAVLARADERIVEVAAALGAPIEDAASATAFYATADAAQLERIAFGFLEFWLEDETLREVRRILALEQYRRPEAALRLRGLMLDEPLTFQRALFAALIARGDFRDADPNTVALAFWGPIHALLVAADQGADRAWVEQSLRAHIAHFRAHHLSKESGDLE